MTILTDRAFVETVNWSSQNLCGLLCRKHLPRSKVAKSANLLAAGCLFLAGPSWARDRGRPGTTLFSPTGWSAGNDSIRLWMP